jgi:hypothetical protein
LRFACAVALVHSRAESGPHAAVEPSDRAGVLTQVGGTVWPVWNIRVGGRVVPVASGQWVHPAS